MTRRELLAVCGVTLSACGGKVPADQSLDFGEPKNRYALRGEVLRLRPKNRIAVVKHEKIEGWMEPMTMDFPVPDATQYAKLREGATIRATVLTNDAYYWLTEIQVEQ